MTADDCRLLTRKMYQKLADITGWEREDRTDEEFAMAISQDIKHRAAADKQLLSEELKLWKPNGEDWKLKREIGLQILANLKEDLNEERKGLADDSCLTLDIRIKSSDGTVLPVISSVSNEIGPEGGRVEFQLADVILDVPQSALSSAVTFSVKAYVDPACFPPVTLKDEVLLSPVFHLSSSLPHDHHFKKPLQLQLPLEVPLRSSDRDSGWLLQLKRSESSDSLPSEWHTVLELNTETGEVMSQSFLQFDYSSGTLHLDQFSCFAWLGKPFRAIRGKLGFSPVRKINYAVFGKQVQNHKWCIAIHIIHGSKVVYESLVHNLKGKDYVELTHPKNDCIQSGGKVSVCIQCLEPWQVRLGKKDVQINTNQIWRSGQHSSCYHEVTVEDSSLKADVLECTIEASFQAKGNRNAGDSVELVVSQPLQSNKLEAGAADCSPHRNPDSESKCSSTPELLSDSRVLQAVLKHGGGQWFSIGLAMGFTGSEVEVCTSDKPSSQQQTNLSTLH